MKKTSENKNPETDGSVSKGSLKDISGKPIDIMTPEQMDEMIDWFNKETEQLTKDIHKYNDSCDYYRAAQAEGMRDSYLRCIKKLYELEKQSGHCTISDQKVK